MNNKSQRNLHRIEFEVCISEEGNSAWNVDIRRYQNFFPELPDSTTKQNIHTSLVAEFKAYHVGDIARLLHRAMTIATRERDREIRQLRSRFPA